MVHMLLALGACNIYSGCLSGKGEEPLAVSEPEALPPPAPEPVPEPDPSGDTGPQEDGLDTDGRDTAAPDTGAGSVPVLDFQLADENPYSETFGDTVSPRSYLGHVTGWYFIKAT